jgi:peptidoglycan/xylan/chitin deacetylase (PgdA/CDA1 family)
MLGILGRVWYRFRPYPVILCYHSVNDDNWFHGVSLKVLQLQLTWLRSFARPVTLDDVYKHITGEVVINTPAFAVTFDDGYKSIMQTVPFLNSLNIVPTFFVLSKSQNANHKELDSDYEFLTTTDMKKLVRAGWLIGSHSATHGDFWAMDEKQIAQEVYQSKVDLEKRVGVPVKYFAYPRGRYNKNVLSEIQRAGYTMALSMDDGMISVGQDPYTVPRTGINRTHSFAEFKSSFPPTAVYFRKLIKRVLGDVF